MPHTLQEKVDEGIMQVLKELETAAASVTPLKIDRRKVYAGDTASDRARAWVNARRVKP